MNHKLIALNNVQLKYLHNQFFQLIGSISPIEYKYKKVIKANQELFITSGQLYFNPDTTRKDIVKICTNGAGKLNEQHPLYLLWKDSYRYSPLIKKTSNDFCLDSYMNRKLRDFITIKLPELPSFIIEYIRYGPHREEMINLCSFMDENIYYLNKLGGKHWCDFLSDIQNKEVVENYRLSVIGKLSQSMLINNIPIKSTSLFHALLTDRNFTYCYTETFHSISDINKYEYLKDIFNELVYKGLLQI